MTKEEARTQFALAIVQEEDLLELDRATLLIAAEEYPHLQIEKYLQQLDYFAASMLAEENVDPDAMLHPFTKLMRLGHWLFNKLEMRGNRENYYDVRNSFLNDVIDRRIGIPITLSVIYIEVARRIGLKLSGVGMPGHFLVKYSCGSSSSSWEEQGEIFIDPFHGGRLLTSERCREMILEMYDGKLQFHPALLHSVSKKQILARMLQNLKGIYTHAMEHHKTLGVIERLLMIDPSSMTEIRDRGLTYFALEQYVQARADLEQYLFMAPLAKDVSEVKKRISQLRQRQAKLN